MNFHSLRFPKILALSLALLTAASAALDRDFKTTPVMRLETRALMQMLEVYHYNKDAVTAANYPQLISDFMAELDPQRLFFTAEDEQAFRRQYGTRIETDLAYLGNIDIAFDIYRVYEQRVQSRTAWVFEQLKQNFDFNSQESYTPDRSKSPFPANAAAADDVWHRRIKYEILQDLLSKKPAEDAKTTVRKRYDRMLKNLSDIEAADIQEMYLTCLTRMYDPHSDYFSADTLQDFSIQIKLSLIGIGAVLSIEDDGNCVIREVVPGGPAFNSGQIHASDKILAVKQDGAETIEVVGMKLRRIVDMIRGNKGTKVTLTILPHAELDATKTKEVVITRDIIKLNSSRASASVYDVPGDNNATIPVGVIVLNSFYGPSEETTDAEAKSTATKDVAELIGKLKKQGIKGLVIDLRRNGGGLLSEAVDLTGLFVPQGPVVQVRDSLGQVTVDSDTDSSVTYDGPLAVLTSRFSASASEIFAGALQNYGRAVIVGDSSTHGKGTVQAVLEMKRFMPRLSQDVTDTGAAKLTVQKFYLPNGSSTQMKGVIPDISLPSIDDYLPIGEASLPHALMWDEIKSTSFQGKTLAPTFLKPLLEASHTRQDSLAEFSYLKKNIDWFKERQEQKTISLNLQQRQTLKQTDEDFKKKMDAERDVLAKANYVTRPVKLDSVVKAESAAPKDATATAATANPDDSDADAADGDSESKLDVHLRETLRILKDAMHENPNPEYWADATVPATAAASLHKG
ncbi:MAG TPA: carboxy terminal-processing peptidase [Lacunisphaera sp.]